MVVDSSAAFELLVGGAPGVAVADAIEPEGRLAAPDVLVVELVSVLRRWVLRGELAEHGAVEALEDLGSLPIDYFPTLEFRRRAWELRHNFFAADAMFAALAEVLDTPLLTTDRGLARAARKHLGIETVTP